MVARCWVEDGWASSCCVELGSSSRIAAARRIESADVADRARAIVLSINGWTSGQIARAFGMTPDSVRLAQLDSPARRWRNGWRLASAPPLPCRATRPAAVDRAGLRLKLLKQQPEPGDIVLLSQDKPEALTHPWFGQAVGLGGPAGATGGQRAGAPARCYADPARPVDRLGQTVNDNPNSVEITAANINEIEIGRSVPIEANCT